MAKTIKNGSKEVTWTDQSKLQAINIILVKNIQQTPAIALLKFPLFIS